MRAWAADRHPDHVTATARGPGSWSRSSRSRELSRSRERWLLAGIVVLAALVRVPTLGLQSFWYDEAVTHGIVAHGLGHVLSTVPKTESTPPLYYVLVWLWSRLFGVHEWGLRSFSALCGMLTVLVMWQLGRRLVSSRVGLIAALLTAVNPILFWYSQEARSYALLVLMGSLSLLGLVWALESPSPRRLLAWGALAGLALCVHYFAAFVLAPEAIWLVMALRHSGKATVNRLAAALTPVVVAAGALLPLAIHQNDGRANFIADRSGSLGFRAVQLVKQDVVGFDEPSKTLTSIVAVALVAFALLLLVRRPDRRALRGMLMPLIVGAGAVLLALLVAIVGTDYVNTRNLLASWPALALIVATGYASTAAGWLGRSALVALSAISLACVAGVDLDARFQRGDWRGAASAMGPATATRAIVADHNAPGALEPYATKIAAFPASLDIREVDVFALVYRKSGAHVSSFPPRPAVPAVLPGFAVVQRRETDGYTLVRYRSPHPVRERPSTLIRLSLTSPSSGIVLVQTPSRR